MNSNVEKYILKSLHEEKISEYSMVMKNSQSNYNLKEMMKYQNKVLTSLEDGMKELTKDKYSSGAILVRLDAIDTKFDQLGCTDQKGVLAAVSKAEPCTNTIQGSQIPDIYYKGSIESVIDGYIKDYTTKNGISLGPMQHWKKEWTIGKNRAKYNQVRNVGELYLKYIVLDKQNGRKTFIKKFNEFPFGKYRVLCQQEYEARFGKLKHRFK